MPLDDLFAKGEADAGPRVFFSGVQALKEEKDAFEIFWRNPDPIVRNRELPLRALALGANVDLGWVLAPKLNGIANQILKKLRELHGVALNGRQWVVKNRCAAFLEGHFQICQRPRQNLSTVHWLKRLAFANAGITEQSDDQRVHALGALQSEADKFVGTAGQFARIALPEQLQIIAHHAERLLQVM